MGLARERRRVAIGEEQTRAIERLRARPEPATALPVYQLVRNEAADPALRRAAAEALVDFGLLRRPRVGPSRAFGWLLALTLVIVAAAAADTIGPVGAIVLFVVGEGALVAWYRHAARRERDAGIYIDPDGTPIDLSPQ